MFEFFNKIKYKKKKKNVKKFDDNYKYIFTYLCVTFFNDCK